MGRRNRDRLEQFDDPENVRRLLAFPEAEAARALRKANPFRRAKGIERALAVSLLIFTGLRIKNLRHIRHASDIRRVNGRAVLKVDAAEVKNGEALEFELQPETLALLDRFLAEHRPQLPGSDGPYLFPGQDGGPKSDNAMREAVSASAQEALRPHAQPAPLPPHHRQDRRGARSGHVHRGVAPPRPPVDGDHARLLSRHRDPRRQPPAEPAAAGRPRQPGARGGLGRADAMRKAKVELAFRDWPERDRRAWEALFADGDPLEEAGAGRHWAASTRVTNRRHYARWLAWLTAADMLDPAVEPWERATPERVRAFGEHLIAQVAPRTAASVLIGLKVVLKAMHPEGDWRWLMDLTNRLNTWAEPAVDRTAQTLPIEQIHNACLRELDRLLETPLTRRLDRVA